MTFMLILSKSQIAVAEQLLKGTRKGCLIRRESLVTTMSNADTIGRFRAAQRFARVQAAKRERARRAAYLPSELFAEPAWDILLELYALELVSRGVSEAELAERTSVPNTTTVRWMKMLEAQDLITRSIDARDPLRVRIALSAKGREALDGYFSDLD